MLYNNEKAAPGGTGRGFENDQLGGKIDWNDSLRYSGAQGHWSVTWDDVLAGFIVSAPRGYEAITTACAPLGRFNTAQAAANALLGRAGACCHG